MLPTVKVKLGADDYTIINEADFDPKVHVLFDAPVDEEQDEQEQDAAPGEPLTVAKRSKGLWFVRQAGKNVSAGFPTEEAANAKMAELANPQG